MNSFCLVVLPLVLFKWRAKRGQKVGNEDRYWLWRGQKLEFEDKSWSKTRQGTKLSRKLDIPETYPGHGTECGQNLGDPHWHGAPPIWASSKWNERLQCRNTRASRLRRIKCPKQGFFTNKYLSKWSQMKALNMPFQMRYGSLLSSKQWLSTIPKCRGHLVEASSTQKATK